MEQGIHTPLKGELRKNKHKIKTEIGISIGSATYLQAYKVLLFFNNGEQRIVNFLPLFSTLAGAYAKYNQLQNLKKFIVKNGNIFWGKNEEVIFPVNQLYKGRFSHIPKEQILYVL